ncbi:MAG: hypothetical protein B6I31_02915 [Desulfobacteraceae bacterium 4572_19]|nr:MAG: hypothetical protein B6I31_02915 [Desulfobacteraceae bacterium 4572_19]
MNIRKSAFAGSWYPDTSGKCEIEIKQFLNDPIIVQPPSKKYIAGIVPHAGWYFSGSIACNVISLLQDSNKPEGSKPEDSNPEGSKSEDSKIDVMVIFGMHLPPESRPYIMTQGAWQTPFGDIKIHENFASEIEKQFDFNVETVNSHVQDNTIELQLPFVKYFFNTTKIVPIGVPPLKNAMDIGKSVVEIAEKLDLNIKVLGSTDLTHYGPNYGFSRKITGQSAIDWVRNENDKKAIDAMVAMSSETILAESITNQNTCCGGAVAATISAAKELGSQKGVSVAYATSYDKHKEESFVGYSGIVF